MSSNMYSAIIVEDMPQARQLLEADLARYCPEIVVEGIADSVVSAAKLLKSNMPDILFLDIALGDGTGFDLLEIFPALTSKIIFITAFDEYAIRAFQYSATDYLLKPIEPILLVKAVEKAKVHLKNDMRIPLLREHVKYPNQLPSRIALHNIDKISIVTISEIVRCEADGNNTLFYMLNQEKIFVTKTLKHFETLLQDHPFVRAHQSHLVNISFIHEFSKKDGGFLKLKNGHEIPVSVRKKPEIMLLLENLG